MGTRRKTYALWPEFMLSVLYTKYRYGTVTYHTYCTVLTSSHKTVPEIKITTVHIIDVIKQEGLAKSLNEKTSFDIKNRYHWPILESNI